MTDIRTDEFAPGDLVVWEEESKAAMEKEGWNHIGDGPFEISWAETQDAMFWSLMGHKQFVRIKGHRETFSGFLFKKVTKQ